MNDKLTLEELAQLLASACGMEQRVTDVFVESFFALIEEGLKKDRYVRIKGFGTFKLIEVDNEADGGENTDGMTDVRIIFVPESSVREVINKPFSHFETVELNEGVHFDDIEEVQQTDREAGGQHVVCEEEKNVEEFNGGKTETDDTNHISDEKTGGGNAGGKKRQSWYIVAGILSVGILIGMAVMWGFFSIGMAEKNDVTSGIVEEEKNHTFSHDSASVVEMKCDSLVTAPEVEVVEEITVQPKIQDSGRVEYLSDKVAYKISGTIDTHTIVKGNTLAKIAYKYYRNRKLWPYIVMHNKDVIKDPNNVPIGTVLAIPRLEAEK